MKKSPSKNCVYLFFLSWSTHFFLNALYRLFSRWICEKKNKNQGGEFEHPRLQPKAPTTVRKSTQHQPKESSVFVFNAMQSRDVKKSHGDSERSPTWMPGHVLSTSQRWGKGSRGVIGGFWENLAGQKCTDRHCVPGANANIETTLSIRVFAVNR